nr:MAG TPA: hypothetical protein [Bacteriophage sp.]DAT46503.1 MAG TPA: hypothetical protein [Caudoviricetes sp.]
MLNLIIFFFLFLDSFMHFNFNISSTFSSS